MVFSDELKKYYRLEMKFLDFKFNKNDGQYNFYLNYQSKKADMEFLPANQINGVCCFTLVKKSGKHTKIHIAISTYTK